MKHNIQMTLRNILMDKENDMKIFEEGLDVNDVKDIFDESI